MTTDQIIGAALFAGWLAIVTYPGSWAALWRAFR